MIASPFLCRCLAVLAVAMPTVVQPALAAGAAADAGPTSGPEPQAAATAAPDPAAGLSVEQQQSRAELEKLSSAVKLSKDKIAGLQADIASIDKDRATLRTEIVDAAEKQKALQRQLGDGEARLAALYGREDQIHRNLQARRGVLAEVLGALERMGRDPPPALLVTPSDALSSVRSAILLGSVVPEMRQETEALAKQLQDLVDVRKQMAAERDRMKATLTDVAEEQKRLELLLAAKKQMQAENRTRLAAEQQNATQLASKASNVQDLINDLESRIQSAREAARKVQEAEDERRRKSADELARAREKAGQSLPDKNRIAPAYAFSDLKHKLELPVAGEPVKWFGDDDGTGHPLQGMMISTQPDALVTAPADAWVVYAGPFRSYGDLVILNTGDGYHVVMAGMEKIDVGQGQFVVAGEPIAEMGRTRLAGVAALALVSTQPTLYIEFRKDGKPVDPRPWWSGNLSGRVSNGT
ncbi:MAG: murein hydrolase activator EnvC family protein [Pararhizobium sp.]